MTEEQTSRYIELVHRRVFILTHSGVDWKSEYAEEMKRIDEELRALRPLVDQEHNRRERTRL